MITGDLMLKVSNHVVMIRNLFLTGPFRKIPRNNIL